MYGKLIRMIKTKALPERQTGAGKVHDGRSLGASRGARKAIKFSSNLFSYTANPYEFQGITLSSP